ncbi:MAG: hypothetical protein ACTTKI_08895 [Tannerella sp.]|uniref:hypothetical protein n=1 Tax=Tannerella sp. TaxID=2382127 RepID=UPI003FA295DE
MRQITELYQKWLAIQPHSTEDEYMEKVLAGGLKKNRHVVHFLPPKCRQYKGKWSDGHCRKNITYEET